MNRPDSAGVAPGPLIVVPCYEHEELVAPLFDSLSACAGELRDLGADVLVVDDAPHHGPLREALHTARERAADRLPCVVHANAANIGFVASANLGLARAAREGRDAILLNSDTQVFPGAFTEMIRVAASDPMIGFVSPRSNNATIASLPAQESLRGRPPRESYEAFRRLEPHLPPHHYVPTAVGFCLLVKNVILREFGLFDEAFGAGYNEENDLVMRANRCGYRAALANRAFVHHLGESSFGTAARAALETENAERLAGRYPEYFPGVRAYEAGPVRRAEEMLTALLPDERGRHDLLFDFSDLGSYHNGTIEAATAILRGFAARHAGRFNLFVSMHAEHARYHGIDRIPGVEVVPRDTDRAFAVGFRVGQPFTYESFLRLNRQACRTAWFMLDTITWDCLYLRNPELDWTWRQVFRFADAVLYNSDFTRRQFAARFPAAPAVRHLVSPHSLDPREYLPPGGRPGAAGEHLFVIGNKFAHKFVRPTVDAILENGRCGRIVCLGPDSHPDPRVACHASGHLTPERMERFFERATAVVFPSHYEGFGFPVLKALAYEKPILMRDTPLARELKAALDDDPNIVLYSDTAALAALLGREVPVWQPGPSRTSAGRGWDRSVDEIAALLDGLVAAPDAFAPLVRRLDPFLERVNDPRLRDDVPYGGDDAIARLPPWLRRVRSVVVGMPTVRRLVRPAWRRAWKWFQ